MARARWPAVPVLITLAIVVLAGVPTVFSSGSSSGGHAIGGTATGSSGGSVTVAPAFVPGPGIRLLGPLGGNTTLDVAVSLASPDPAGLAGRLSLEYAAGSPEFHQFLTAAQVRAAFAPTPATYDAAVRYFEAPGVTVVPSPDGQMLLVQGPASALAVSFHTEFDAYSEGTRTFYSHSTPSTLPGIAPWAGVVGLGNATPAIPFATAPDPVSPQTSCSGAGPYIPCAVASAYNVSGLYAAGTNGTGVRLGVVDTYDGGESQSKLSTDLATFAASYGLSVGSVHYLYPVPTPTNLNRTSTGWATEEALDLEWARASAPGAALDMTFAPDATAGLYFAVDWLISNQLVDVVSLSWGEPDVGEFNAYAGACALACNATSDGSYALLHPVLAAAALEGIGVFAASGDCGAAMGTNGLSTSYPASDPDATGVGATALTLNGIHWDGETAWSGNATGATAPGCQNQGGSGGGFSPFPRPYWQTGPGLPSTNDLRGVPDVSIIGGSPVSIVMNGFVEGVDGTSVSTPIWAGLAAVADQLHGGPLGLLDPSLYALGRGPGRSTYFHDVTTGSNGYSAGPGWDAVTGLGSPNGSALLDALAAGTDLGPAIAPTLAGSNRSGPLPLRVSFSAGTILGAPAVSGYDVSFGNGNSTWTASGAASYDYRVAGIYAAQSVVFYTDGNTSVSPPVLVMAGAGAPLGVTLALNETSPAIGAPVTFAPTISGGVGPFHFDYFFGDGTYYQNATAPDWSHSYDSPGGFCAVVVAWSNGAVPSGGASVEVPVEVGGAPPALCPETSSATVRLPTEPAALDLPANVNLVPTVSGGAGPFTYRFVSDDPYVTECQCGIFRIPGTHSIRVYANDSVSDSATAEFNLTVFPALAGSFSAGDASAPGTAPIGPAPLSVTFAADVSGGEDPSATATVWTFGDGSVAAVGATANHTYTTPGWYVASAIVHDATNGTAAGAFLIDVQATSAGPTTPGLSVQVNPGAGAAAGNLVAFTASSNVGSGGVAYEWQLGDDDSAFGWDPSQSYTEGCLAAGACPLQVTINGTDPEGAVANTTFTLPFDFFGRSSALDLSDQVSGGGGATPFPFAASASTAPMPGARVGWAFGDGNSTNGTSVQHTYYQAGNYTVVETATDTIGDESVRTHAIVVTGPPVAPLVVTSSPAFVLVGILPFPVVFHANASGGFGGPYTYVWHFGDGAIGAGPWANHTYETRANFTANLTVTDVRGTEATTSWSIDVYEATVVVLTLRLASSTVAPSTQVVLTVTESATSCTSVSVPGCSPANVTLSVGSPGLATFVLSPIAAGGSSIWASAGSGAPGEYPIWVNATGFYQGSAETVLAVAVPAAAGPSAFELQAVGAGVAGGVALAVVAYGLVRKRAPPVTP